MNRIIVRGEPVGPFQYVSVFVDNQRVESLGVKIDDLVDITFALITKYEISHIDLSGTRGYMQGIEQQLKTAAITTYGLNDLTFKYV